MNLGVKTSSDLEFYNESYEFSKFYEIINYSEKFLQFYKNWTFELGPQNLPVNRA